MITSVRPHDKVSQTRNGAIYQLVPEWWGDIQGTPTSQSIFPSNKGGLFVRRIDESDLVEMLQEGQDTGPRRRSEPSTQLRGAYFAITGGIEGAQYEVRISPELAFIVRVTPTKA